MNDNLLPKIQGKTLFISGGTECSSDYNVLEELKNLAVESAPDYPNIELVQPWEHIWAIRATIQGTQAANKDLHLLIDNLRERLEMNVEEVVEIGMKIREEQGK